MVKWLILIMIICAFTGLLTPIGDTPYTLLPKLMQGNTTQNISEHQPLTLINNKRNVNCICCVYNILNIYRYQSYLKRLFYVSRTYSVNPYDEKTSINVCYNMWLYIC